MARYVNPAWGVALVMSDRSRVAFRPDADRTRRDRNDTRSPDRIRAHYELELELAQILRSASRENRKIVYGEVYRKLFEGLPDHPQNTRRVENSLQRIAPQIAQVKPFLTKATAFLEVGCGDAALAIAISGDVRHAFGLDVTDALLPEKQPDNFSYVPTSGANIDLPDHSIDFAYSNQLAEHLHPDDARDQFAEIRRVLRPGGRYYCTTPSRVTGPHDVSCYFDYDARGFHLKEYDYDSLRRLFLNAGFKRIEVQLRVKRLKFSAPFPLIRAVELAVLALPVKLRQHFVRNPIAGVLFGLTMIGVA
jgi:SAM-dependent methyltransferase